MYKLAREENFTDIVGTFTSLAVFIQWSGLENLAGQETAAAYRFGLLGMLRIGLVCKQISSPK